MCDRKDPRVYYVEQDYPVTTPTLTIAPGGTQTFSVRAKVISHGQVQIQLNIFARVGGFTTVPVVNNITYNILRDGLSISASGQNLVLKTFTTIPTTTSESNSDVILQDEDVDDGYHDYSVVLDNIGALDFLIDTYSFVVQTGETTYISSNRRDCSCTGSRRARSVQSNQLFTPMGIYSATIAPGDVLVLPVEITIQDPYQVQLELNFFPFFSVADTGAFFSASYQFTRDCETLTFGPQTIGSETLVVTGTGLIGNDDIVFIDTVPAAGTYKYAAIIANNSIFPLLIDNYCFTVSQSKDGIYFDQLYTPSNIYLVLPNTTDENTISFTAGATLDKRAPVKLEFNATHKILTSTLVQDILATYTITRNGYLLVSSQILLNLSIPAGGTLENNNDVVFIDEDPNIGTNKYVFTLTNSTSSTTNLNIDNYSWVVTPS